ncbi:MAG: primosomal protein N' [Opitutales bacterium]
MNADRHAPLESVVSVYPLAGVGHELTYKVPQPLRGKVAVGMLVQVPLGRRQVQGVITGPGDPRQGHLKFLLATVHPEPVLSPDLVELATWMARYYAAPLQGVYELMLPAAVRSGMRPKVVREVSLVQAPSAEVLTAIERRAPKQAALLDFLRQQSRPLPRGTVLKRLQVSPASLDSLIAKGIVSETSIRLDRAAYDDDLGEAELIAAKAYELNDEQQAAVDDCRASLAAGEYRTHLLHGVTGSGKTEVYLHALRTVLDAGGSGIFLVPEVALTPQTLGRLQSRLEGTGTRAVVWHSHLSGGERFDAWMAMARGEARVVVGPRSALFAPLRGLKLIIVDEEHEAAYKQEETPRYHGRDVAVYRARLNQAVCLLGSATPSLESLYNVREKGYRLNRLTRRVDRSELPAVYVVDMKPEALRAKGVPLLSSMLKDKLQERFERKEQSILFINRRGYSRRVTCPQCGYTAHCPHCSVALTYHRTDARIRCHLCGYAEPSPRHCPECRSAEIRWQGFGTQRVEDVVAKVLPAAKVVRLDADTMHQKNLFRKILTEFRQGRIDVLVGTQMIAKGLDFPNVTLVGLVDADLSLHVPDFRAGERTFQLIVQVAGRAGRGDQAGEVVIQTFTPHAPPIQYARRVDFEGYLDEELEQRREFHYPPFRHLVRHLFRGRNPDKVAFYAEEWSRHLQKHLTQEMEIRGPAPAPIEKAKDFYRFHLWYFVSNVSRIVPEIAQLRETFPLDPEINDVLDVDPMDLG